MNKYQESLDYLKAHAYEIAEKYYDDSDSYYVFQRMDGVDEVAKPLQELVDKYTPKKPSGISLTHEGKVGNCPHCNKFVRKIDTNICECGQRLDWSD